MQILIQPVRVGTAGVNQYPANAINVGSLVMDFDDTTITINCTLVNIIDANNVVQVPAPFGTLQTQIPRPANFAQLKANGIAAILAIPTTPFIQR